MAKIPFLILLSPILLYNGASAQTKPAATTSVPSSFTTSEKPVLAPTGTKPTGINDLLSGTLPDLGLKIKRMKEANKKSPKKKVSKTDYAGLPMVKASTKYGSGDRAIIEEFYVLKTYQEPNPYAREVFWYDSKGRRVTSSVIKDKSQAQLLHGPYKRYQAGNLVEEGYYYAGTKDGRWEKYDQKFMLLDKINWYRGFPAESRITYYDSTHTKIKEIIPVEYGQTKGRYMAFYQNGQVAEDGTYDNGVKVGRWTEYYPNTQRRMRKKLMQYGRDRWDTDFEPYVISEWDEKGKMIYERSKEKSTTIVEDEETDN